MGLAVFRITKFIPVKNVFGTPGSKGFAYYYLVYNSIPWFPAMHLLLFHFYLYYHGITTYTHIVRKRRKKPKVIPKKMKSIDKYKSSPHTKKKKKPKFSCSDISEKKEVKPAKPNALLKEKTSKDKADDIRNKLNQKTQLQHPLSKKSKEENLQMKKNKKLQSAKTSENLSNNNPSNILKEKTKRTESNLIQDSPENNNDANASNRNSVIRKSRRRSRRRSSIESRDKYNVESEKRDPAPAKRSTSLTNQQQEQKRNSNLNSVRKKVETRQSAIEMQSQDTSSFQSEDEIPPPYLKLKK